MATTARGVSGQPRLNGVWERYFQTILGNADSPNLMQRFLKADLVRTLRRMVPETASVLEAGVGRGALCSELPNVNRTGIDIMPQALERARQRDPSLTLHLADAVSMKLGKRYDAIICDRLCHFVPDIQGMLENLVHHLEDDGRLFLTCFNYTWSLPLDLASLVGLHERSPPQNWLTDNDFINLFQLTGLEEVGRDERLILPLPVPVLAPLLNRVVGRLPPFNMLTLYRMYVLRKRAHKPRRAKVTVVVPARNEAGNIQAAIERMPVMGKETEVIFVEGGSTDDTAATVARTVAEYKGPLKLRHLTQTGKGKGDAVRLGFEHARGDLLMILDADLTVPPEDLARMVELMERGVTDYVQGTRLVYPMQDEAMRVLNRAGNSFFAKTFTFLLAQPITDTLCGTKVLWRRDWERIQATRHVLGDFDPFGDFDLLFGARRMNLKILEVPVRYGARTYGTTNISRFRHGLLLLQMSAFAARKLKFV